jgi:hypothetical protein
VIISKLDRFSTQPSDGGGESTHTLGVASVVGAVGDDEVRLLDESHLDFQRGDQCTSPMTLTTLGIVSVRPVAVTSIAVKIGLRTIAKRACGDEWGSFVWVDTDSPRFGHRELGDNGERGTRPNRHATGRCP